MATYSFTLDGIDDLQKVLKNLKDQSGAVMGQALYEEANVIFANSQVLVPVDTGVLRGSGGVSAPQMGTRGYFVDIFYGGPAAPYALIVHEIIGNYHNPPTQAKYLERPLMDRIPAIQQNLSKRILHIAQSRGF
jgi:hypothetical protein